MKNNIEKFDDDFRFQLTAEEWEILRSNNLTSSWGGTRYLPYAFTEQGIYMLMTVLRGERVFHCGASSKDAGVKATTIMEAEKPIIYHPLIDDLLANPPLDFD